MEKRDFHFDLKTEITSSNLRFILLFTQTVNLGSYERLLPKIKHIISGSTRRPESHNCCSVSAAGAVALPSPTPLSHHLKKKANLKAIYLQSRWMLIILKNPTVTYMSKFLHAVFHGALFRRWITLIPIVDVFLVDVFDDGERRGGDRQDDGRTTEARMCVWRL